MTHGKSQRKLLSSQMMSQWNEKRKRVVFLCDKETMTSVIQRDCKMDMFVWFSLTGNDRPAKWWKVLYVKQSEAECD